MRRLPARAGSILSLLLLSLIAGPAVKAELDPLSLPLISISDFEYRGAFRVPADTGSPVSNMQYAVGPIAYNPDNHSIFMVGHAHHQAVVEFAVPEIVNSTTLSDLKTATLRQNFTLMLERVPQVSALRPNRIAGMSYIRSGSKGELLVNANVYYTGDLITNTTFTVRDTENIGNSAISGFFDLEARELASGWISPIPQVWQSVLGGTHLVGHASNISNRARLSVGPSAYVFDPYSIVGNASAESGKIRTQVLQVFPDAPGQRLHEDLENKSGNNDLWTDLSEVHFGFIVPGTRTFATIGHSGGHGPEGICYKCTDSGGRLLHGPGARDADDWYQFYWLWDVNDLVAVKNGKKLPHEARPYERGVFPAPMSLQGFHHALDRKITGGVFDEESGSLYLTSLFADGPVPVVLVYDVSRFGTTMPQHPNPNPPTEVRAD